MTHQELRTAFFKFYSDHGHVEIGAAPLVPERDTSVLFTTAGMHPLIPYLTGDSHPDGTRLMNIQRSLRTTDVDEVGDATHSTVFEMLGHWSLGDYWKREAISWSYEFVTKVLGFSKDQLAVTIFQGDEARGIGRDEEAEGIWKELGVTRIAALGDDNFWGPVHSTGPCGPTTEIFVPASPLATQGQAPCALDCFPGSPDHDSHWVEIWNNVFMGYQKTEVGTFEPLKQKNIDTGVGLERVLMTVNHLSSIYETDVYQPIVAAISPTGDHQNRNVRLVADHIKAAVFMIADGVLPNNKDRGYVLRRLIRRAVRAARAIQFADWSLAIEAVVGVYGDTYSYFLEKQDNITATIVGEQTKFESQLTRGETFLRHEMKKLSGRGHPTSLKLREGALAPMASRSEAKGEGREVKEGGQLSASDLAELAFLAYQSHALPGEISLEILRDAGAEIDTKQFQVDFDALMAKHQAVSRAGSEKKFGGHGLILDTGELKAGTKEELRKVLRLHTATHLLQAGLRAVLGDHVQQKGSDINADRLRFDYFHPTKLTDDERTQVEAWVNDVVAKDLPMQYVELPLDAAKQTGALHYFGHKYPPVVKVYFAGTSLTDAVSKEFCGGPHVEHTSMVGEFRILKEESASSGVRRIKADVE